MLTVEIQKSSQVTVLRCSGRIVKGDGADALLRAVMLEDTRDILIDLNQVTAMDAAGLGALAELERWARESHRSLRLVNPSRRVREVLETTGLSSVIQITPADAQQKRHSAA